MQRILFICHGNICRSPMAEFIMKALLKAKGLENSYYVESAAVSTEEIGNPIYPPAKRCLSNHGVIFDAGKRAKAPPAPAIPLISHRSSRKSGTIAAIRPALPSEFLFQIILPAWQNNRTISISEIFRKVHTYILEYV